MGALSEIERRRAALAVALEEADRMIAPALAEVRARLFELEEALRPAFVSRDRIRVTQILDLVAALANLEPSDVSGPQRNEEVFRARSAVAWVARNVTNHSLTHIGRVLGGRDHSTMIAAVRSAERRRLHDEEFKDWTDRLRFVFTPATETPQCQP